MRKMIANIGGKKKKRKKELGQKLSGRVMFWNDVLMREGTKAQAFEMVTHNKKLDLVFKWIPSRLVTLSNPCVTKLCTQ